MTTNTRPAPAYTLHVYSEDGPHGGTVVKALIRKAIPAGIDGPLTASVALQATPGEGTTEDLADLALEAVGFAGEFAAGPATVSVGWAGLSLEYPLLKLV